MFSKISHFPFFFLYKKACFFICNYKRQNCDLTTKASDSWWKLQTLWNLRVNNKTPFFMTESRNQQLVEEAKQFQHLGAVPGVGPQSKTQLKGHQFTRNTHKKSYLWATAAIYEYYMENLSPQLNAASPCRILRKLCTFL